MTETEKIAFCKLLITDVSVTDDQISAYLAIAADKITDRVYPFGGAPDPLPTIYDYPQCELCIRMIARRGGEGEIAHSENGISRTYGNVDDEDILAGLTPYVGVI